MKKLQMSRKSTKISQISINKDNSSTSSSEEVVVQIPDLSHVDLPAEYWKIQKLVRYVRTGNPTATLIALCGLKDYDLCLEINQLAVREAGGLEILLNILECTNQNECRIGALQLLKDLCTVPFIRLTVADLGGIPPIVRMLYDQTPRLQQLAAETIANVSKFRKSRQFVREEGGIKRLVDLLDGHYTSFEGQRCAAMALWSLSRSKKVRVAISKSGGIPLLAKLLKTSNIEVLIPVVGVIRECASDRKYQIEIRKEGIIKDLVTNLKSTSLELRGHCASAIYRCAADPKTRSLIKSHEGLNPLVELLQYVDNSKLISAATGAIWMCSMDPGNMELLVELGVTEKLVSLLKEKNEEVLINVAGALAELCRHRDNCIAVRNAGGIPLLIEFLTSVNTRLLVNSALALGSLATESESMRKIENYDGVRLLWSLLKNSRSEVQAAAANAICPCVLNAYNSGEMVRSFVGGLELLVHLLKSPNTQLLSYAAAAIAAVAKDEENLGVLTDHGVVRLLAQLSKHHDLHLRKNVAKAIAQCCSWGDNRRIFGEENCIVPLIDYLNLADMEGRRSAVEALYQLSLYPLNCVTMHKNGILPLLLNLIAEKDEVVKQNAADCLQNVRLLSMNLHSNNIITHNMADSF